MNIKAIKEVVNSPIPDENKEYLITQILSQDRKLIPILLDMLNHERNQQKELIDDLNVEVSRYHSSIKDIRFLKKQIPFYNQETKKLYEKWKGYIGPLFNNKFDQ